MRSPENAVSDVLEELNMQQIVIDTTVQDPRNPERWLIKFESKPEALIHSFILIEIMENNGDFLGCVLQRHNCGRRAMTRIMDLLMNKLESLPPSQQQPLEEQQPALPASDRNGPPGDDRSNNRSRRMRR